MPVPDLSPAEFRHALVDNGFGYLGRVIDRYVDIAFPRLGLIEPVTQGRRTLRRQTLQRLLERRAAARAEKRAEDARRTLIEATAGAIAPQALPPCRADLMDAAAIAQLADDFVIGTTTSEGLTFGALLLKGWRPDQIKAYADAARAVADRKQIAEVVHG